jgi:hypothetical protein
MRRVVPQLANPDEPRVDRADSKPQHGMVGRFDRGQKRDAA